MSDDGYEKRHAELMAKFLRDWQSALTAIFPNGVPASAKWIAPADIVSVLNKIGKYESSNHLFFPNGGGNDLVGSKLSTEPNAIEFRAGGTYIVKPASLTFQSFGNDKPEWSYFRLETEGLEPSGVYEGVRTHEELTELSPGEYVDRGVWESGYYGTDENGRERPLPKGSRCICRFMRGAFVIFSKGSVYNEVSDTYDGRHGKMSAEHFQQYIERSAKRSTR